MMGAVFPNMVVCMFLAALSWSDKNSYNQIIPDWQFWEDKKYL